jgi:hypothetical protein
MFSAGRGGGNQGGFEKGLSVWAFLGSPHQTGVRLAEIAFLLILFAGVWLVAAQIPLSNWLSLERLSQASRSQSRVCSSSSLRAAVASASADLRVAGLRATIEVEGSLGARVRASRQRRDCVIAVIGASEVEAGNVQVIDVTADFKGSISHVELIDLLSRSRTNRVRCIEWPYSTGRS